MPKITCVQCEVDYKIVKSGNYVIDMFLDPPQSCKIQNGDRWECPVCGHQVVAGYAQMPLSEHYQDNFEQLLEQVKSHSMTIHCYEFENLPFNGEPVPYNDEDNVSPEAVGADLWF